MKFMICFDKTHWLDINGINVNNEHFHLYNFIFFFMNNIKKY